MKETKYKVILYIVILAYLTVIIFPFFWIFITSLKPTAEIFGENAFRVIASNPTIAHFKSVLFEKNILTAIKNSLIVSVTTTAYVIAVSTLAAYAISRFKFRGKNLVLGFVLAVSMFPQMVVVGPIYNMFMKTGLTNSYFVVLAYSVITLPMAVWILVGHFNKIPLSLEESAKIDGASAMGTLIKVLLPLATPGIATASIIVFINAWNEFLLTITLNTNKAYQTVPVAISYLRTQFTILWGEVAAATVVVTIPTLIIVLLFQKQIISGLTSGAIKE